MRLKLACLALLFTSCAHIHDLGMFYTERGLAAAEAQWDLAYYKRLEECKEKFAPATPEAKQCFGPTFEADKLVEKAVEESIEILREYWNLRAHGYEPDLDVAMQRIREVVRKLPRNARQFFERVEGLR